MFLLRPELAHRWDLSVYLHVPESVTLTRASVRDAEHLGGAEQVRRRYERRYLPGQPSTARSHARWRRLTSSSTTVTRCVRRSSDGRTSANAGSAGSDSLGWNKKNGPIGSAANSTYESVPARQGWRRT